MTVQRIESRHRDRVKLGFGALAYLGFSPTQQAKVFGHQIYRRKELRGVKIELGRYMSWENQERVDCLVDIATGISSLFGEIKKYRYVWLTTPLESLDGKSPKEFLINGGLDQVRQVLGLIRRVTG